MVTQSDGDQHAARVEVEEGQLLRLQQMAILGSYVGSYLHEERNLLSHLSASLSDLFHHCRQKRIQVERIDSITEIVEMLRHHHDAFVSFYRWDRDESTWIPLERAVRRAVDVLHSAFAHQDIKLSLDIANDCVPAMVPDPHLRVVLVNLLSNAFKALDYRSGRTKRVAIAATKRDEEVQIDVLDNGPGIPPNMRERIWDVGFTTRTNGLGVGLPIVKRLVDLYGGRVWEDGASEWGSAFHVIFPAQWREDQ
jgi:signal transduction histidine kinase